MIKVTVLKEDSFIKNITIKGHSGYDEQGKDIVCASVSTTCITVVNAILNLDNEAITFEKEDGYLSINILKHSQYIDVLLEVMLKQLEDLEKSYPKNVKIMI